jgi:hypothetical protein
MPVSVELSLGVLDSGQWGQVTASDLYLVRRAARERRWDRFMVPRANPANVRRPFYRRATRAQVLSQRMHLLYREAVAEGVGSLDSRRAQAQLAREWLEAEIVGGGEPGRALDWFIALVGAG